MALTLPRVTGASKKMSPLRAMGSLFRAPTMEYVVDEVARTHQADVYEMKTEERPEMTIIHITVLRVAGGKFLTTFSDDQFSRTKEQTSRIGMVSGLYRTLLNDMSVHISWI
jgi:hypothetical protein